MPFSVIILGSNASVPAHNRNQTSQLLTMMQIPFLIDCGEGTQLQLKKNKVKAQKIDHIFISHLHGDHYYGLIGLISSLHLYGRKKDLNIYGPPGLKEIISINLKHSQTHLNYQINLTEWEYGRHQLLFENQNLTVHSFPLNHRIPCSGFVFRERPKKRRIDKRRLTFDLPPSKIIQLKNGEDIFDERTKISYQNDELTLPPAESRSYAFCSDTKYDENILPYIKNVDILYHEATFMEDMKERAAQTFHSTTLDAATIALKAEVKRLLIGHFSTRYKELLPMLAESKSIFENTELALEGHEYKEE
ncbi:ribonuclease Z [Reichenbachiella agarivorans]|uniref:Ribonuclease Z n=1 Tax=Reichenbachiella agarivorans TaxID=2979464 RepID=A0ABY6CVK0_9BACT|nr:ribonuclease Z [Reichenbachiella agarivorans]UXP33959.1 ribonuclease Z [Reichenbachiella agarivorans]